MTRCEMHSKISNSAHFVRVTDPLSDRQSVIFPTKEHGKNIARSCWVKWAFPINIVVVPWSIVIVPQWIRLQIQMLRYYTPTWVAALPQLSRNAHTIRQFGLVLQFRKVGLLWCSGCSASSMGGPGFDFPARRPEFDGLKHWLPGTGCSVGTEGGRD